MKLQLTRLVQRRNGPLPGDRCPVEGCDGVIGVQKTGLSKDGAWRIRWLHCTTCGHLPEKRKWLTPEENGQG